jgi:uncharacterized membrane protein
MTEYKPFIGLVAGVLLAYLAVNFQGLETAIIVLSGLAGWAAGSVDRLGHLHDQLMERLRDKGSL